MLKTENPRWQRHALACALLALSSTVAVPTAWASHVGDELVSDQQAVAATDQMLRTLRQFENAPAAMKEAQLRLLVQQAEQRRQRMLRLLERNPSLAALRVLPEEVRQRLPEAARALVEQNLRLTGAVAAVVGDDFVRGVSQRRYVMRLSNGAEVTLRMGDAAGSERDLLAWAGRQVGLDITLMGDQALVRNKRSAQLMAADGAATTDATGTPISNTTVVQGAQKTLVILTNFTDKALSCTAAEVNAKVFGATGATVNNNYVESSRGLVSFNGQVVGPFTIPYASGDMCTYAAFGGAAEAAAKAAGFDPTQYQRVSYVLAGSTGCGWSGLAYMPGRQSWINSCTSAGVYSHELGHNLSLHHAATPTSEYGDGSDPMGAARMVRHNGANLAMAGWLPNGAVVDASAGGSFALSATALDTATSPQVLRLAKADTSEYYYLSMRQAIGLDAALNTSYLNTLSVHRATGKLPAKTFLVKQLAVGQSFVDSVNGITVTMQGLAGNVATVGVAMGGGTCQRLAPTVSVAPGSLSGSAGTTQAYTLTVANGNSAACGSSTFNLSALAPSGFAGSLNTTSLTLAAGASASATYQLTSPASAVDASYTFDATAADAYAASSATTAHGSYVIYSDKTAPTLAISNPLHNATVGGRAVTISATASDASGIAQVEFYVGSTRLAVDTSAPYSATWNLRKVAAGTYTLTVKALDKAGNVMTQSIAVAKN